MHREHLPISTYREELMQAVHDNSVVIITAETGAGKSTQVPQFLLAEGFDLVVTQPRRLAARTVAERVAEEVGTPLGQTVGFRTAFERQDSKATRCLFATDGLALVRELMGVGRHTVLVLDEVHEWNLNIEVLVAWAKQQVKRGASFKLVLMSATLEAERLSAYFDGAPVIDVPGRTYPVEEKLPSLLMSDVKDLLRQGRNVLVFQPGKSEIGETIEKLNLAVKHGDLNAEVLPLHGDLTPAEQQACFKQHGRPKCIVATNVAQTSVTIPHIDAVVDSGVERRVELVDGIEGLYLKPISLADREQRKGRAGRTKPGLYIDHCEEPYDSRLAFPKAEILRVRLDQTILRLAEAGIDAEELEFFHQPDHDKIHDAKRALIALGCMEKDGSVTKMGRRIAKLPISVKYGRMVIEAERLGVVGDIITIAAILEQGDITVRSRRESEVPKWRGLCRSEHDSDVMAQLTVWEAAQGMSPEQMRENGIFVKAFFQAKEKRRHLARALKGKVDFESTGNRQDILKAVCAGMVDHLYRYDGYGYLSNGTEGRRVNRNTVVRLTAPVLLGLTRDGHRQFEWVVGEPWDLEIRTRSGSMVLALVRMSSKIQPSMLAEVAPQLVSTSLHNFRYDPENERVVANEVIIFNGQETETRTVDAPRGARAVDALAQALADSRTGVAAESHNREACDTLVQLSAQLSGKVMPLSNQQLYAFYRERIGESTSLADIAGLDLNLNLDDYVTPELREEVERLRDAEEVEALQKQRIEALQDEAQELLDGNVEDLKADELNRLEGIANASWWRIADPARWIVGVEAFIAEIEEMRSMPAQGLASARQLQALMTKFGAGRAIR